MSEVVSNVHVLRAGLIGRCPRCGEGHLFRGPFTLRLADRCDRCALNYAFADSGDGPAVFVIIILGFLLMGAALLVEFKFSPALWVHIVLWVPLAIVIGFGLLRPMKATLIALQYRNKAEEGRLEQHRH